MGTIEIVVMVVLFVILTLAVITTITSYTHSKSLESATITRGLNGVAGQSITLQCPAGQSISLQNTNPTTPRAVYVCSSPTSQNFESQTCDPYYQGLSGQYSSYFNPSTTRDVSATIQAQCDGKNSCQIIVPAASDSSVAGICNGSTCTGEIQLIGTYDCVPN
jgi:hypothetical protein